MEIEGLCNVSFDDFIDNIVFFYNMNDKTEFSDEFINTLINRFEEVRLKLIQDLLKNKQDSIKYEKYISVCYIIFCRADINYLYYRYNIPDERFFEIYRIYRRFLPETLKEVEDYI